MKTLEKLKYETDTEFINKVLTCLKKDGELKIYKGELDRILSYLEIKRIGKVEFNIIYNSSIDLITLYSALLETKTESKEESQLKLKFQNFNLPCLSISCISNKFQNNMYTCTKYEKYYNCTNKTTNPLKSSV